MGNSAVACQWILLQLIYEVLSGDVDGGSEYLK